MNNFLVFVMVAIMCVSCGAGVLQHEMNHVLINQKAGIESHIDFITYFPAVATTRDSEPTKELSNLELAHSINESINYNTMPYFAGIMGLIIIGVIYLGEKK